MAEYQYDYRQNLKDFFEDIEMPGGYSWNQAETLRRIDLYYNSKFETGEFDDRGWKKLFTNIVKPPCDIARKFVDLDTKDVILFHQLSGQEWKIWLMGHELKQWLKENKFGDLLNKIAFNYPKYGHVVLRKQNGKWSTVNIQNIRNDRVSPTLEEGEFVYELNRMQRYEINRMPWIAEGVKELLATGEQCYDIYSCYERGMNKKWKLTIRGRLFDYAKNGALVHGTEANINKENDYLDGITLFEAEMDKLPYRELKWEDVPGRWLGMGYVEYLFDDQIAENEAEYHERDGLRFTSLHLFQTRDDTIGKNVLQNLRNGDILKITSELTPVLTEERNLAAFNATRGRWGLSIERKTFTSDITRGGDLPSRTPLGVANLSAQQVASHYDLKRENFGFLVKDLLLEDVISDFKKNKKGAHEVILRSGAAGVEKFIELIARTQVDKAAYDFALGKGEGFFPDTMTRETELQRLIQELKEKKGVALALPEGFYEDAEFGLDINITGEQIDTGAMNQTIQLAMQLVATNPAILTNPATRTMLFKSLELAGVSPIDLGLVEEQAKAQPELPLQPGGSAAAPSQGRQVLAQGRQAL